jgi:hypothetical protein
MELCFSKLVDGNEKLPNNSPTIDTTSSSCKNPKTKL